MLTNALAGDAKRQLRFDRVVSVIGPVAIEAEQNLNVCASDISVVTKLGFKDREKRYSSRRHSPQQKPGTVVWSSTGVEVFDSLDINTALPIVISDLIFSSGKGACVEISGRQIANSGAAESVVIVLTSITEAEAVFDPLVSGQLKTANGTATAGLLLPAVQSVRDSGGGGGGSSRPQVCCACAPVCACGNCDG